MFLNKIKMKRILMFSILIIFFSIHTQNVLAMECVSFSQGDGSEENPYVITSPIELYSISCNMDKNFILGNDIDLTYDTTNENGEFYNDGRGWIPINFFSGTLDGNNHKIVGMHQVYTLTSPNNMAEEEVGLFGMIVNGGSIKNLELTDVSINILENKNNGYNFYVGALVSFVSIGNLENITTTGEIIYTNEDTSTNYNGHSIGGVTGRFRVGEINKVINNINVTYTGIQDYDIGGITGALTEEGKVLNSVNNGNIISIGNNYGNVGGLIGTSSATSGDIIISSCTNNGKVYGAEAAGIVSEIHSWENLTHNLNNLSNYGNIESYNYFAGGIVAIAFDYGNIEKSFNMGTITTDFGLVGGIAARSYINISDSFNIGKIEIKESLCNTCYAGGIVGEFGSQENNEVTILNSYSANRFFANETQINIGAIVGNNYGNIEKSYYYAQEKLNSIYTNEGNDKSVKLAISEMGDKTNFLGFDFENVWNMNYNSSFMFPQLNSNKITGNFINNIHISEIKDKVVLEQECQINVDNYSDDIYTDLVWYVINEDGNAVITDNGKITGTKAGKIIVGVYSKNLSVIYDEIEITINEIKDVNKLSIEGIKNATYNGNEQQLDIIINDGNYILIENIDYNLNYYSNVNAGEAMLTITGIGNYKGTRNIKFLIEEANIEYTSSDKEVIYDGNEYGIDLNITTPNNVIIKYADTNGNYTLDTMPKYKNTGTYTVKYQLSIDSNHKVITDSNTLIINKATIKDSTQDKSVMYDGKDYSIDINVNTTDYTAKYSIDNDLSYSLTSIPKFNVAGRYTINYKLFSNNFYDYTAQRLLTIYGVSGFDSTLKLNNNILAIRDYNNIFLSLYKRINCVSSTSVWKHLDSSRNVISNENVKTGDYVQLIINNTKTFEYQFSVLGDVNGDGKISALDYVKIKNYIMKTSLITINVQLISADLNEDGKISALDYVKIKNYIMNGGK